MPSKERYAKEKAKAAAAGTTPYKLRAQSVRRRAPGASKAAARGHAEPRRSQFGNPMPSEGLQARRRRRERRERAGTGPTGWCVVCGAQVEESRARSYSCRTCGNEQVRRFKTDGIGWASFNGLARLAADQVWVRRRRRQAKAEGTPLHQPQGVSVG